MKHFKSILSQTSCLLLAIVTTGCTNTGAHKPARVTVTTSKPATLYLGSKQPYPSERARPYRVPKGYRLVGVNHLGRHGSRHANDLEDIEPLLDFLISAQVNRLLTKDGTKLLQQLTEVAKVEAPSLGLLTNLGKREQRGIGYRLGKVIADYAIPDFEGDGFSIRTHTSHKIRTKESLDAFIGGLRQAITANINEIRLEGKKDDPLINFSKITPHYLKYKKEKPWEKALQKQWQSAKTQKLVRRVLDQILVESPLANKQLSSMRPFTNAPHNGNGLIEGLYSMVQLEYDLGEEGRFDFHRFFTQSNLQWLEYLSDYDDFYKRGPGYVDNNVTYAMAQGLLNSFVLTCDAIYEGTSDAIAYFRFGHSQTLLPLLALMHIPKLNTSSNHLAFTPHRWRSAKLAPMSGNLVWLLLKKQKESYVQVYLNEQPIRIPGLADVAPFTYLWVDVKELYYSALPQTR